MLSVIAAFADSLRAQAEAGVRDLRQAHARALDAARVALARTPEQLAVLRRAGVVDAGAQGFVDLLEGIADYIARGRAALRRDEAYAAGEDGVVGAMEHVADERHRYCTECVLAAPAIDRAVVRAALAQLDHSSLVLAGTREKLRVHVHLDEPQRLYDTLAAFGRVQACKADDMRAQQRTAQTRQRAAVVVDSAADLAPAALETLPLHLVPVRLNFGERDYLDKVSLSAAEFFRELRRNPLPPRTSQPPPGDFRRLFDFLLSHHDEVVYVGLSRAVSGTLQAGESAAARSGGARVHVVDTRNASCGQGLLAERAAELAQQGLDAAAIARRIQALVPRTHLYAYVRDLAHVVRGGRFPPGRCRSRAGWAWCRWRAWAAMAGSTPRACCVPVPICPSGSRAGSPRASMRASPGACWSAMPTPPTRASACASRCSACCRRDRHRGWWKPARRSPRTPARAPWWSA